MHGPTLTIEGRDAEGEPRSWYVRLWNYADGTPEDAAVAIDFGTVAGGWEADDPVWAGDIDRMFVSLVAPDYDGTDEALATPAQGWAELGGIACEGSASVLAIGDTLVPEHGLRIASGYDDLYHLTPARMLRGILQLGYRGTISHYVGMSHYFELDSGHVAGALNAPCAAWHADFLARAKAMGFEVILSLSYELLDLHCPEGWKQRAENGDPALTGWDPPSALLSPANADAMDYLEGVARAFVALAVEAEQPVRFQVGEPWWWVLPDGRICLYDDEAVAAFAPVPIADVGAALDAAQLASLDDAGAMLAVATEALCEAVRDEAEDAECLLLIYMPTVLGAPEIRRANAPLGWAAPAFDRLQLEDYEWVTAGRSGAAARGAAELAARLGYPIEAQHYFAGFVLEAENLALWTLVAAAADAAVARGTSDVFVWALPQVLRDGFVHFDEGEQEVDSFEDVRFPIGLGREVSAEPAFSTAIVTTAGGAEQRNSEWADARLTFDAAPGVRGEGGSARPARLLPRATGGGDGVPARGSVRQQLRRHDRRAGAGGCCDRDWRRRPDRLRIGEALWRSDAADHAAGGGDGAGCSGRRRDGDRLDARRERRGRIRHCSGGGRGGHGRLPLRRAGALRRGPAEPQPRHLRGGRNAVGADDRDPRMTAFLDKDLATIALCWRLERRDGVTLGFTTHDRDLAIGGVVYRAAPGMLPSAISLSDGFDAESLDVEGALTDRAISAADLGAGRWDGAALSVFMVDWEAPDGATFAVARGELGEVSTKGDAFEAELRGPAALLDAPVVEQTSPECRAALGDKRCRVDMAGRILLTRIAAVIDEDMVDVEETASGAAYSGGALRWIGGANSGLESPILRSEEARLTLAEPPPFAPSVPATSSRSGRGATRCWRPARAGSATPSTFAASRTCRASTC